MGWDNYGSTKLKPEDVKENPEGYIVVKVDKFKGNNVILPEFVMERAGKTKNYIVKEKELMLLQQAGFKDELAIIGQSLKFQVYTYFNQMKQQDLEAVKLNLDIKEIEEPSEVDTDEAGINEDSTI